MAGELSTSAGRESLLSWLERAGWHAHGVAEIAGDVSARRYFRVDLAAGGQAIVASYPLSLRPSCTNFVETSRLLSSVGIRTPEILHADCDLGLMLVEDAGDSTLYDLRDDDWSMLLDYLLQALDYVERIRSLPVAEAAELNPPLDEALLWRELKQTWRLCLEARDLVSDDSFAGSLQSGLRQLCHELSGEKLVSCHRDFMARNLVPTEPRPSLIVLDHQDLRPGPTFYDLASLLNDSLFPPPHIEEEFLERFLDDDADRLAYHRAAAQRTLKAVGTFEAVSQRGDPRHRPLIAPTLARALRHLQRVPETESVTGELGRRLRPLLRASAGG